MIAATPPTQRETSQRAPRRGAGERAFHRAFVAVAVVVELAWLLAAACLLLRYT